VHGPVTEAFRAVHRARVMQELSAMAGLI